MFDKVLIANRGEIAVRVAHACHELGLRCVAVYSEPDRLAPHVLAADEAIPIGPAPSNESYLRGEAVVAAALQSGAGAIHPGYGFLAENAAFAAEVAAAGLVFVGPPPAAIEAMGDKTAARRTMHEAGVPVIPGSGTLESVEDAVTRAEGIGYPVMLKAVAGGGGKGMRVAQDAGELRAAFPRAGSEAVGAFGDGRLYLERHLRSPRHVEIQILADAAGHTVHLGERECSIQRRHQKLIEEAPSPALDGRRRTEMGEVAVRAAQAVGYRGAGTVEFLLEGDDYLFLEMNTRLQVEHPVTELVTGVDLVQEQLLIAAGEELGWTSDPGWPLGHAIECRLTAEDPYHGFLPSTGRIERLRVPGGPAVRWDSGIAVGFEIGLHYDPLLAKLIVHAPTRDRAIARMQRALRGLGLTGVATTQPFHLATMAEEDFRSGRYSVRYLDEHPDLVSSDTQGELIEAAIAAAVLLEEEAGHGLHGRRDARTRAPAAPRVGLSAWQRSCDEEP